MNLNKIKINLIATVILHVSWNLTERERRLFRKYIEFSLSDTTDYNKLIIGVDPYKSTTVSNLNFDDHGRKFLLDFFEQIRE